MKKPRVIYIMGCGRSGTTILDIILGNNCDFLSVGELNNFRRAWVKGNICSCGVSVKTCKIWRNIGNLYFDAPSKNAYVEIYKYQISIERQRAIWRMALGLHETNKFNAYESFIHDIFKRLQEASSCKAIIDSSKSVGRAYSLLRNDKINVQIIHIVRDPRGMYYSFQKKNVITPVKGIWSASLYWNTTNLLACMIKSRYGEKKILQIRYEDLVHSPDETIDQIATYLDENLTQVKEKLKNKIKLTRGHIPSGNRLRTQKDALNLTPDFEWKKKLNFSKRLILSIICSPLMISYKYFQNGPH